MRETENFSMYSDMSMRTMALSSPNMASARALQSSVLPTPVGPRNRKEPMGRFSSLRPARARRMARATALTASSWPMTRLCSASSRWSRRLDSSSVSLVTGMCVQAATISATSSSPTSFCAVERLFSHSLRWFSMSARMARSSSRTLAARSKSWWAMASSFSLLSCSSFSSICFMSGGVMKERMRTREAASSMRSMALSGR